MRLGGPVFSEKGDAAAWVAALKTAGYRAAAFPLAHDADRDLIRAHVDAAQVADILIAEVGAWSNPISPDDTVRHAAIEKCQQQLALADEIGAGCCVNIAGSRNPERWDGPHPDNLTSDTFDLIVETVRSIIDAVRPQRAYYTLETMPWVYPDSADSYLALIDAIDRPQFAVHFDPVNLICSPQRCFENAALIRDFIQKLGPYIKSCHAKDITLANKLTVHLDEVRPGAGVLDYHTLLPLLENLSADIPLLLEHLEHEADYRLAADHIRQVAAETNVRLV